MHEVPPGGIEARAPWDRRLNLPVVPGRSLRGNHRSTEYQILPVQLLIRRQALLGGLDRRKAAAFLFDQVVLHAALLSAASKIFFHGDVAFAEQDAGSPSFARRPSPSGAGS